ncbi:MAG: hypothetical protein PHN42_02740 [Bacilli bacterium]|nr:hypothetical protein [Bacilli bacterium]
MILEPKILEPIALKLSDKEKVMITSEERLSLDKGVMFGTVHYGFNLLVDYEGKETEEVYATQCRIIGVQIVNDYLNIYEENKYIPWRFDKNTGVLINRSTFSNFKRSEMDYLRETFGIVDEEGLNEINNYKKK